MSGRPAREDVVQGYLTAMLASISTMLTADTKIGSNTLLNVNVTAGQLLKGLPLFGPGIAPSSIVTSLSPLTLSLPALANASQASFTTGIVTSGRRVIPWDECQQQPALFVRDPEEDSDYQQQNQLLTINAQAWLYNKVQSPDVAPVTGLNYLLDALQAAMQPDFTPAGQLNRYTIGGLVFWCRINGRILKDPGDADGQAIALVPVEIIVP